MSASDTTRRTRGRRRSPCLPTTSRQQRFSSETRALALVARERADAVCLLPLKAATTRKESKDS